MSAAFVSEVGVCGDHVAREPTGPQVGLAPNALHDVLAHTEVDCDAAARPLRCPTRRWTSRGGQHPPAHPRRQLPRPPASVPVQPAFHAVLHEPAAPRGDGRTRHVKIRPHGSCGTPSARSNAILARWTNPAAKAWERAISSRSSHCASVR